MKWLAAVIALASGTLILAVTLNRPGAVLPPQSTPTFSPRPQVLSSSSKPDLSPSETTTPAATPTPIEVVTVVAPNGWEDRDPFELADAIGPLTLPSDCGLPLDEPASMPSSPRDYRAGVHQGIDFICGEVGHTAVAARDGIVVMAVGDYLDPTPAQRAAVLDIAVQAGRTPPWTLAMLFGNFVVVDHGVIADAGHVVTIYAHLDSLADGISPGARVRAGEPLGRIGNRGTYTASSGGDRGRSIHLHWEIHVDDVFLGAGLGIDDTRRLYESLFGI